FVTGLPQTQRRHDAIWVVVDRLTKSAGGDFSTGDRTITRYSDQELRLSEEARIQEKEEADELYRDVNINQGMGLQVTQNIEDSHVTRCRGGIHFHDGIFSDYISSNTNTYNDSFYYCYNNYIKRCTNPSNNNSKHNSQKSSNFNSAFRFDERLRSLETTFSEYRQTNPFVDAVSAIPVQIQTDRLQDSLQRENDEFLRNIDENMKKIIKGQVKSQVKEQVSRILPRIEESVNGTLEAEILIEKMEGNKSIQRSDEQQNLYKALVEAYDADKAILDSYGESTILKRGREDDDQEGPFAGSDRGSKRLREGGEHASASTPSETATGSAGRSTTGSQSRQLSANESTFAEEPVQTTCQMEEPPHPVFETGADDQPIVQTSQHPEWFSQPRRPPSPDRDWNKTLPVAQGDAQSWISDLARQINARSSFDKLLNTAIDFSNFIMNRLNVDTLTPELLAGPTYELMRGSCTSLTELEYYLE
nr:hypothetical protein [Tanacetum cinerariifolium]